MARVSDFSGNGSKQNRLLLGNDEDRCESFYFGSSAQPSTEPHHLGKLVPFDLVKIVRGQVKGSES